MNEKLKALAKLLNEKGLYEEADATIYLADKALAHKAAEAEEASSDEMVKEAIAWFAAIPLWGWIAGASATAAVATTYSVATSSDGNTILSDLTSDFEMEEAGPLYLKWYKKLSETDLIDGHGTFPVGHPMGGAFMRKFIGQKWNQKKEMTEAEFEDAFEHYYGESAAGVVQYGLDNEGGWVDTYNAILALSKGQESAIRQGKDWKTDMPPEKDVEAAKEAVKEVAKKEVAKKEVVIEESEEPQAKLSPKRREILGIGSKGSTVKQLQLALLDAGFSMPLHGADGSYGSETKDAVIAFKRRAYIDGRYEGSFDEFVNEETLALIESYGSQKKSPPE